MGSPSISFVVARETLLALLVLALAFLNFGHASISVAGELTLTPDSWCNDPLVPVSAEHSPCHACRIGSAADLPPPPATMAPICFAAAPVLYAAIADFGALPVARITARPRAPPAA